MCVKERLAQSKCYLNQTDISPSSSVPLAWCSLCTGTGWGAEGPAKRPMPQRLEGPRKHFAEGQALEGRRWRLAALLIGMGEGQLERERLEQSRGSGEGQGRFGEWLGRESGLMRLERSQVGGTDWWGLWKPTWRTCTWWDRWWGATESRKIFILDVCYPAVSPNLFTGSGRWADFSGPW